VDCARKGLRRWRNEVFKTTTLDLTRHLPHVQRKDMYNAPLNHRSKLHRRESIQEIHRLLRQPHRRKVCQHHIRVPIPLSGRTVHGMSDNAVDTVRAGRVEPIGNPQSPFRDWEEVEIEVVVHEVELLRGREWAFGAVDGAREGGISGVVRVFPHLRDI